MINWSLIFYTIIPIIVGIVIGKIIIEVIKSEKTKRNKRSDN